MRTGLIAALFFSPLLAHAQANKPNGLMLSAASAADRGTPTVRVSTGVVPPKLIHAVDIEENTLPSSLFTTTRYAVVSLIVDEKGIPSQVKIVESPGTSMNKDVVDAVSQYRFKPATVSGQATAVPVQLHLTIQESAE